jgi:hypothetical protein
MTHIIVKNKDRPDKDKGLEGRIAFILMKAGVTEPDIDACIEWAFGKDAWYAPICPDWINRWNKLHPKMFRARRKDSFVKLMYVIGAAFAQERYRVIRPE